jgi:hypothetical protein
MKKKKGGFVHMLGPFEVGGSHGTVGHGSRKLSIHFYGSSCNRSAANSRCSYIVGGELKFNSFDGEDANQESTNTSTSPSDTHVTGEVHVYGYINGTDPDGGTNLTLEVQYNLEGLGTACNNGNGSCSVEVNTEADSSCDSLIDRVDESVGNRVLLTDLSQEGMGTVYIDIGTPIAQLFNRPMSVRSSDGTVFNCAIFTEHKNKTASVATGTGNSPSGAMGSTVGLVALVVLVASFAASFVTAL